MLYTTHPSPHLRGELPHPSAFSESLQLGRSATGSQINDSNFVEKLYGEEDLNKLWLLPAALMP